MTNLAATFDTGWNVRAGNRIQVRRTDGSNRTHEAICTDTNRQGIGFHARADFAVGEVVELLIGRNGQNAPKRERARVLYRNMNLYGLGWLIDYAPEPAPDGPGAERLAAARHLLARLRAAYQSLPSPQRAAVRNALHEQAAEAA